MATCAPLCPAERAAEFRDIAEGWRTKTNWFCMSELAKMNATQEAWEEHWRIERATARATRMAVQISTCRYDSDYVQTTVLCNDGTILMHRAHEGEWWQLPPIPQPESA